MDFHKAFDRVWHSGLLYKLGQLGISHSALSWLQDYLTNRTLSVKVGQSRSPDYQLSAGVPQGSHLGPVLFLAYINDLPTVVTSPADLYADDTLLHDTVEQASALQRNINAAVTWATTWRGGFSAAKTILLHIGNRNRSGDHTLNISGQPLQADTHHKHLGLIFSDSLSWSYHLDKLIISSRRKAGLLRYMTPNMSAYVSSKLYLTWVRPTMEYACPVWHASISREDSLTLERIQASVARRILQADWSTPKELLFQSLDWPATVVATFRPQCVSSVRFNDQCHLPTERLSLSVCLDQVKLQLQKTKATPVTENPLNTTPAVLLLPCITFVEHIAKLDAASIVEGNFQERSGKTLVTPQV